MSDAPPPSLDSAVGQQGPLPSTPPPAPTSPTRRQHQHQHQDQQQNQPYTPPQKQPAAFYPMGANGGGGGGGSAGLVRSSSLGVALPPPFPSPSQQHQHQHGGLASPPPPQMRRSGSLLSPAAPAFRASSPYSLAGLGLGAAGLGASGLTSGLARGPPRSPASSSSSPAYYHQQQHHHHYYGAPHSPSPHHAQHHAQAAAHDMRSLTAALAAAQPGTGEVRRVLAGAAFKPRLPGLTKIVSQLSREGAWQKALEVFESLPVLGVVADTAVVNAAISACDRGAQWQSALEIWRAMAPSPSSAAAGGRPGARPPRDAITYSALISALAKGRQWGRALEAFAEMAREGVAADAVVCCTLISCLDRGGQWQLAEQVFTVRIGSGVFCVFGLGMKERLREGLQVSPFPLARSLAHRQKPAALLLRKQNPKKQSKKKHQTMYADLPAFAHLLEGLKEGAAEDDAEELAATTGMATTTSAGSLSPATDDDKNDKDNKDDGKDDKAQQRKGRSGGSIAMLPDTLDTTAQHQKHQDRPQQPPRLTVDSSPSTPAALLPSPLVGGAGAGAGSALLGAFGSGAFGSGGAFPFSPPPPSPGGGGLTPGGGGGGGMGGSAASPTRLLRSGSLNAKKLDPNRVCCNSVLSAYARASPPKWRRAMRLLRLMAEAGGELSPDIVSYNTVLKAVGAAGQVRACFDLFAAMRARGVEPTAATFSCLVAAAGDSADGVAVRRAWGWLRGAGAPPHVACVNTYLAALVQGDDLAQAWRVFRAMVVSSSSSPSFLSSAAAAAEGAAAGVVVGGVAGFGSAESGARPGEDERAVRGVRPNAVTYNVMMGACLATSASTPRVSSAAAAADDEREGGRDKQPQPQPQLTPELVEALFAEMLQMGLVPTSVTHGALASAYARMGRWQDAAAVLEAMPAHGGGLGGGLGVAGRRQPPGSGAAGGVTPFFSAPGAASAVDVDAGASSRALEAAFAALRVASAAGEGGEGGEGGGGGGGQSASLAAAAAAAVGLSAAAVDEARAQGRAHFMTLLPSPGGGPDEFVSGSLASSLWGGSPLFSPAAAPPPQLLPPWGAAAGAGGAGGAGGGPWSRRAPLPPSPHMLDATAALSGPPPLMQQPQPQPQPPPPALAPAPSSAAAASAPPAPPPSFPEKEVYFLALLRLELLLPEGTPTAFSATALSGLGLVPAAVAAAAAGEHEAGWALGLAAFHALRAGSPVFAQRNIELWSALIELLVQPPRGRAPGLAQAALLCLGAHAAGTMRHWRPAAGSDAGAEAGGGDAFLSAAAAPALARLDLRGCSTSEAAALTCAWLHQLVEAEDAGMLPPASMFELAVGGDAGACGAQTAAAQTAAEAVLSGRAAEALLGGCSAGELVQAFQTAGLLGLGLMLCGGGLLAGSGNGGVGVCAGVVCVAASDFVAAAKAARGAWAEGLNAVSQQQQQQQLLQQQALQGDDGSGSWRALLGPSTFGGGGGGAGRW